MFDDKEIRKQIKESKRKEKINKLINNRVMIDYHAEKQREIAKKSKDVEMLELLMESEDVRLYLSYDRYNFLIDLENQHLLNDINALNKDDCTHPLYIASENNGKYYCTCAECGKDAVLSKNTTENIFLIHANSYNVPEIRSNYFVFKRDGYSLEEIIEGLDNMYNTDDKNKNLHV